MLLLYTISNTSIKNNIATSISYIYVHDKPVIKMIYHAVNITTTKAELFTIRCGINQVTTLFSISNIIVLMDSIHVARRIFDSLSHSSQLYTATISAELRIFFSKNHDNSIKFWKCSSCCKWPLYKIVNKETK